MGEKFNIECRVHCVPRAPWLRLACSAVENSEPQAFLANRRAASPRPAFNARPVALNVGPREGNCHRILRDAHGLVAANLCNVSKLAITYWRLARGLPSTWVAMSENQKLFYSSRAGCTKNEKKRAPLRSTPFGYCTFLLNRCALSGFLFARWRWVPPVAAGHSLHIDSTIFSDCRL